MWSARSSLVLPSDLQNYTVILVDEAWNNVEWLIDLLESDFELTPPEDNDVLLLAP